MRDVPFRLRAATAMDLCDPLALGNEARALLPAAPLSPSEYVLRLRRAGLHADAVLFLAHGLEVLDAVWWGLVSALVIQDVRPDPAVGPALDLVGDWTLMQLPEIEAEARLVAQELELESPAAWVALSVSLSRAPEGAPPERYRLGVAHAIATSVGIAATLGPSAALGAYSEISGSFSSAAWTSRREATAASIDWIPRCSQGFAEAPGFPGLGSRSSRERTPRRPCR